MYKRQLLWLIGIPLTMGFQRDIKPAGQDSSITKVKAITKDSVQTKSKRSQVKQVKANKTKIHHIKKVEPYFEKKTN